jgi:hypothetical protein
MSHDPVQVFVFPASARGELYNEGEGPSLTHYNSPDEPRMHSTFPGNFADLPIEMPTHAIVWLDRDRKPVAAWATWTSAEPGNEIKKRIRWKDLDIFWSGIRQYNEACKRERGQDD